MDNVTITKIKTATTTPVLTWVSDKLHPLDTRYRLAVDGVEYIKSTRKHKPPRALKAPRKKKRMYKPCVLSPASKLKRRDYMRVYRSAQRNELRVLKNQLALLQQQGCERLVCL
jgi:hypothetical protein